MSRAFVKEQDESADNLPDRAISEHRNFVTARGLAAIDAVMTELRTKLGEATAENRKDVVVAVSRDLRYWTARRASAELVEHVPGAEVRFGSTVMIERGDGREQTFQVVGEDEADPAAGTLSYVAPLARALMGKSAEDEISFRSETIVIVKVV